MTNPVLKMTKDQIYDAMAQCCDVWGYEIWPEAIDRLSDAVLAAGAPSVADAAGASEPTRWQKAQALFGGGFAADLPENIDWTRVMALAEKHGDGWSEAKGWSFHCDDDLFNFAGELAKESGND
ncbi:hypothetical protein [Caballeronia zhejiangensis]|uniref:Uncharacterized protein n=1 Tax=Caballeronia zhejiangensis TaxID=871203 RepID=A0A656Q9F2_9BURK|nr:hypothetical protein [Caballeronia zhejiangensis]KDR25476.1 hypothetical protein BG60_28480 [Caballeronia zhejiangensis]